MPAKPRKSTRLAVTYRSIASLSPDPGNARTHPKAQLDQIAASIRVLRSRTLDHPGLEFPGFIMMAGWMCHHERAM
jgi:hypothetical protein